MMTVVLALWSLAAPPLTDEQADATILALVSTPQPIPSNLPAELGPALERFWIREQLWTPLARVRPSALANEIGWTRGTWPIDLPKIDEGDWLPSDAQTRMAITICRKMQEDLDNLAANVPEWNEAAIAAQRAELDQCWRVCYIMQQCREGQVLGRRHALAELHEAIGDEAWYGRTLPPLFPWWRVPCK